MVRGSDRPGLYRGLGSHPTCFRSTTQRLLSRDGDDCDQIHAKIFEVVCRQIGQQFRVDRIRADCRPLLFKTERSQPIRGFHIRALTRSGRWSVAKYCSVNPAMSRIAKFFVPTCPDGI
jgi:hypothetical protein